MSSVMAQIHKDYIYSKLLIGERVDGRSPTDIRDISVETGVIEKAEGSALVKIGETVVLVGVKIQPGTPFPDSPNSGVIMSNVELSMIASPDFESGPPGENAVEIARVVDRGIRESHAIDLNKLCIEEGAKVWMIFIDSHVLNDAGNILGAASLGAIAALSTAIVPASRFDVGDDFPLPVEDTPIAITTVEINGEMLFDPSLDEEAVCGTKLIITTNEDGSVSAMQKSGVEPLSIEQITNATELASGIAADIRQKFIKN